MNELVSKTVDLWVAPERLARTRVGRDACVEVLTAGELQRSSRLHHEADTVRYRLARALTRTVLSNYLDMDPRELVFTRDRFGRPSIGGLSGVVPAFSLSHTAGLVVLLVGWSPALGVDVEAERRALVPELSPFIFSNRELLDLESRRDSSRRRRILEYWTLKEAYWKARGLGLSLPLDRPAFKIQPHRIAISKEPRPDSRSGSGRWWFSLSSPLPGYVAAVAVTKSDANGQPPRLTTILLDSIPNGINKSRFRRRRSAPPRPPRSIEPFRCLGHGENATTHAGRISRKDRATLDTNEAD